LKPNDEIERIWKDVVMAHSEILSQNLLERTEENPQRSRVDTPKTSRSQMRNENHSTVMFRRKYRLLLQGLRISQARNQHEAG
jgi:hypothetical protein